MERLKKLIFDNKVLTITLLVYCAFFSFITFFYYQRLAAFGCFDDCFNYAGGYFLLKGKEIYTDFFFNHSFLMPYLSFFIQKAMSASSLYQFILFHKLFLFAFSLGFGILIIYRFRFAGFFALIFYEMTKFYTFGDHFLGESFIVYPLMYLTGLAWEKVNGRGIKAYDYILSGIFAWFCIFTREPYAPLTLFLFIISLLGKGELKHKAYSLISFLTPTAISFLLISPKDFILNVFTYNKSQIENETAKSGGFLAIALYPLRVFVEGQWNLYRQVTTIFMGVFLTMGIFYSVKLKRLGFIIILIALTLASIRPAPPGQIFYEAYHMNVWFALLIFATFLVIFELLKGKLSKLGPYFLLPFLILGIYILLSPSFFIKERVDQAQEFNTNYAEYFIYGNAIKNLANETDTVFVEEKDELIHQIANLNSSYKYNGYTSFMPLIERYRNERVSMFKNNPPDFYYDACFQKDKKHRAYLPQIQEKYQRVNLNGKPSCLLIKSDKLRSIPDEKWDQIAPLGFSKPI